jgi:6-phosphogluconolactonase (cycloisomerase 2 family)
VSTRRRGRGDFLLRILYTPPAWFVSSGYDPTEAIFFSHGPTPGRAGLRGAASRARARSGILLHASAGSAFFEDDEDETEELLTLLGLAALAAANAAPAARDRFVIATSLLNGAPSGQVFMFRKATESCDLVQTHQINTGQNPYDLIVSPGGEHVYIALDGDQAIAPFSIDAATEQLTALSPAAQAGTVATTPYGMSIHPNGRWLYSADGSAPGSVASFDRDPVTGALTPQTPAFLAAGDNMYYATLDRTGGFLYVSNYNGVGDAGNDTVYGYAVNQTTGALTSLGAPVATQNRPWYIARHPTGNFIYVGNQGSGTISMFTVNTGTGALTPIGAGTVAAAGNPIGLAVGQRFAFAADNGGRQYLRIYNRFRYGAAHGERDHQSRSAGSVRPEPRYRRTLSVRRAHGRKRRDFDGRHHNVRRQPDRRAQLSRKPVGGCRPALSGDRTAIALTTIPPARVPAVPAARTAAAPQARYAP